MVLFAQIRAKNINSATVRLCPFLDDKKYCNFTKRIRKNQSTTPKKNVELTNRKCERQRDNNNFIGLSV